MYEEPPEEPAMREEEPSEFYEEVTQPQHTQEEEQVLRLSGMEEISRPQLFKGWISCYPEDKVCRKNWISPCEYYAE